LKTLKNENSVQEKGTMENVGTSEGQNINNVRVRHARCDVKQ